jgi:hypothetical protein
MGQETSCRDVGRGSFPMATRYHIGVTNAPRAIREAMETSGSITLGEVAEHTAVLAVGMQQVRAGRAV